MLEHPTKNCYIFKNVLQALINADILKLRPEQKKVMANMTSFQFEKELPSVPAGVVTIPKKELRVINTDPHKKRERPYFCPYFLRRDNVGSPQHYRKLTMDNCYTKSKGKAKMSFCNLVGISTRETEEDVASLTNSEKRSLSWLLI